MTVSPGTGYPTAEWVRRRDTNPDQVVLTLWNRVEYCVAVSDWRHFEEKGYLWEELVCLFIWNWRKRCISYRECWHTNSPMTLWDLDPTSSMAIHHVNREMRDLSAIAQSTASLTKAGNGGRIRIPTVSLVTSSELSRAINNLQTCNNLFENQRRPVWLWVVFPSSQSHT